MNVLYIIIIYSLYSLLLLLVLMLPLLFLLLVLHLLTTCKLYARQYKIIVKISYPLPVLALPAVILTYHHEGVQLLANSPGPV